MKYYLAVNKRGSVSSFLLKIPLWAQLTAGLSVIGLVYYIAIQSNPYISAWDEESSSFYDTVTQALEIFHINPTAPTAFIIWDRTMAESGPAIRAFNTSPSNLRIYGVHITSNAALEIRKDWLEYAPRRATLLIDRQQLLQTAFHARAFPMVYILLPKQKKIFSYLGNINDSRKRMLEIISSE